MILEIPIASASPHFVQENSIFGVSFFLEFEWIEKMGFWMLHIADAHEDKLSLGIRLGADWPLYTYHNSARPFTFALISKIRERELTRQNLHQNFMLVAYEVI
jgi:hypothetical protein